jgi:recombination protein RecA
MAIKSLQEKLKALDKIADGINKQAGKKLVGRIGNDPELVERLTIQYIASPSQNVNTAMGGGFPRRRMTIVTGKEDSGKTFLLLETIGIAMKKDPNFTAGWLESEGSLELDSVSRMFGIDLERFFYIEHDRDGAGEGALDKVEAALASGAIDMMVINSLKCLVPSEEFSKSMGQVQVGAQARMNAKMTRKFTSIVSESNTAFVIVQHLTTQIGSMSRDPLIVSGGNAILYAASIIMDLRKQSIQEADPISREEGIKIGVNIKKNHCATTRNPYVKAVYYAIFNVGIETYLEALENAVAQNFLYKAGAFIREIDPATGDPRILADGTRLSWQGKTAFREFCIANPEYFESLMAKIKGEAVQMSSEEIATIEEENAEIESNIPADVIAEVMSNKGKGKKK